VPKANRETFYFQRKPKSFILCGFRGIFLNDMALGLFLRKALNAQKRVHNAQIIVHCFRNGLEGFELFFLSKMDITTRFDLL